MTQQREAAQQIPDLLSGGPQVLMLSILQALTNGCDCKPCATLREYGKLIANLDGAAPLDPSSTPSKSSATRPLEGAAVPHEGDPPQTRRFDGTTKEM